MDIILASKSPRRRELLSRITEDFSVIVSECDETFDSSLPVEKQVENVSYNKAKSVFDKTSGNRIIIGSDTIVVKNGKIYGKPKNRDDAVKMISEFKNDKHQVITGLAIIIAEDDIVQKIKTYVKTDVYVSDMSQDEIERWVDSGKALDKAGAYGIQDEFSLFIERIDGDYNSVVGLPVSKVYYYIKDYLEKK